MKKRIFILTSIIPYPLIGGGIVSQYAFGDYLRYHYDLIYLFEIRSEKQKEAVKELQKKWPEVKIHTVNNIPVESIKKITTQKIKGFIIRLYNKISNVLGNRKKQFFYDVDVSNIDFTYAGLFARPINNRYISASTKIIQESRPDLIQVEHLAFMNLVLSFPNNIPSVYVHHELQFARLESSSAINDNLESNYIDYIIKLTKDIEGSFLKKYSAIIAFSEADKKKIRNLLPDYTQVYSSPFPVLNEAFDTIDKESFKIEKLVFVGSDIHSPNIDAINWYVQQDFGQKIFEKTGLKLNIIGEWSERNKQKFQDRKFIKFTGFINDLKEFCRNSIMIVPIRIGSGIRTKILYAMAQGIPVIASEIGCEGIEATNNTDFIIAKNSEDFINSVNYLLSNLDTAFEIAQNGQKFIRSYYSQQVLGERRKNILDSLIL